MVLLLSESMLCAAPREQSAFAALKLIPASEGRRLARVFAFGAAPYPERWHFLVHAPEAATGLREYVVEGDEVAEPSDVSQYAQSLTKEDVIGRKAVKIDSDRIFETANRYALANGVQVASMNYTLHREGDAGLPVWRVDCLDADGSRAGSLVMTAGRGRVLSHEGFAIEPPSSTREKKVKSNDKEKLETEAQPQVAVNGNAEETGGPEDKPTESAGSSERSNETNSRQTARRPGAGERNAVRSVPRPVRRILRRVLPF